MPVTRVRTIGGGYNDPSLNLDFVPDAAGAHQNALESRGMEIHNALAPRRMELDERSVKIQELAWGIRDEALKHKMQPDPISIDIGIAELTGMPDDVARVAEKVGQFPNQVKSIEQITPWAAGERVAIKIKAPEAEETGTTSTLFNDLSKILGRDPTQEEYEKFKKMAQERPFSTIFKSGEGFYSYDARTKEVAPLTVPGTEKPILPIAADIDLAEEKITATEQAKVDVEKKNKLFPKARDTLIALESQWETVDATIDRAIDRVSLFTTGLGAWVSIIPATPQKNLANDLETIRANIGFDKLQDMRANSPTGGALGQVSEFENRLLQAVQGSLDQNQSPAQLRENLARIKELLERTKRQKRQAYETDYAEFLNKPIATPRTAEDYLKKKESELTQ